jgi:hypothetical protein
VQQVTRDKDRLELGSQINNDDSQIDFNEILSDQVSIDEMTPNYERMKHVQ